MTTLFFTEMWERFSYYGMRAILVLYMVAPINMGGLAFDNHKAAGIYGIYTMMVYMTSIPGGYIADKFMGGRMSVLVGGIIIALGHFSLAVRELAFFYLGLALIVIGTGLLKPNISTMLGGLYDKNDSRRDAGFSFFYMGINIGAALSPIVCGFLAQSKQFKAMLSHAGIDPASSWHFGFGAAGIGMLFGLVQYVLNGKRLGTVGARPLKNKTVHLVTQAAGERTPDSVDAGSAETEKTPVSETGALPLTKDEWQKIGAIAILFCFQILFWAIYEQGGSSLNLFADKLTRDEVFAYTFPSSWLQTVPAVFCILLAPTFAALWIKLGDKQPSSPAKFAYGLLFLALGIGVMVPAAILAAHGKVSPLWLVGAYFLEVIGEMCISPVGLSTVTKLAPSRFASSTMGLWFLATAFGNLLAGYLAGFFDEHSIETLVTLFGSMGAASFVAALILVVLTPRVRSLMGHVR